MLDQVKSTKKSRKIITENQIKSKQKKSTHSRAHGVERRVRSVARVCIASPAHSL